MIDSEDPCVLPNTVVTRRAPVGGPILAEQRVDDLGLYVGEWHVHGQRMVLRANGTGTVDGSGARYSVRVTRYRNPDRLLMRVVADAQYFESGMWVLRPADPCTLASGLVKRGDSSILRFVVPRLLQETPFLSHLAPEEIKGGGGANPYWCGDGLASKYRARCGA